METHQNFRQWMRVEFLVKVLRNETINFPSTRPTGTTYTKRDISAMKFFFFLKNFFLEKNSFWKKFLLELKIRSWISIPFHFQFGTRRDGEIRPKNKGDGKRTFTLVAAAFRGPLRLQEAHASHLVRHDPFRQAKVVHYQRNPPVSEMLEREKKFISVGSSGYGHTDIHTGNRDAALGNVVASTMRRTCWRRRRNTTLWHVCGRREWSGYTSHWARPLRSLKKHPENEKSPFAIAFFRIIDRHEHVRTNDAGILPWFYPTSARYAPILEFSQKTIESLIDSSLDWPIDRLIDWLSDWSIDCLIEESIDWLFEWLVNWLLDWSINH